MKQPSFLPMTSPELTQLGWSELDILLITGDAYVDHPSFGAALIGRYLVSLGYRTGIIAQPDWKQPHSVTAMGRPRLFAGITAGAMDSMVANYTANKKLRRDDAYTPGGHYGHRPNRASIIYANLAKQNFPGLPIVLGGIEASMRRLVHYDYWDDKIRRSLLLDAKADILVYGMGEQPIGEIAQRLADTVSGETQRTVPHHLLENIPQTVIVRSTTGNLNDVRHAVNFPSYEEILKNKDILAQAALTAEKEHAGTGRTVPLLQKHGNRTVIIQPPAAPLSTKAMDRLYDLPFSRQAHPHYTEKIPALEPVANSIVTHRGCFGGCSFCALGAHQGKCIQSRSRSSIVAEARRLTKLKTFHGTITDVGGPSANMYQMLCRRPQGPCRRPSCLYPKVCSHLHTSHAEQMKVLRELKSIPGVNHVFVASGIRFDLALEDRGYIQQLVTGGHISGALKIAPEHTQPKILELMRKPSVAVCEQFIACYRNAARRKDKPAYLTAYCIASFPGSTTEDMQAIRQFARTHHLRIDQMQDFIPLPMTLAGIMYATGKNPWTGKPLAIARTSHARKQQRHALVRSKKHSGQRH